MDSSALTHQQLEQEYLQNDDFNGALDACNGQTIVDYITREMGCPLQRAVHEDPAASLRQWIRLYKQGQFKGLVAGAIGVAGVLGGFMVGSQAWSAVCAIGLGMGFFTFKNHKKATEFSQHEEMVLNQLPGILDHLAKLEASGIRTSAIVPLYNCLISLSFDDDIDPQNPYALRDYFETYKRTSQVFQEYSPIPQSIAPAPSSKKAIGSTTRLNAVETDAVRMLDNTPIPSWKPAVEASVVPQDKPLREEPVEDYWGKGGSIGSLIDKAMGQIQQAYLKEEPICPQVSPAVPEEVPAQAIGFSDLSFLEDEEEKPFVVPSTAEELRAVIKESHPELLRLMKSLPIRVVGRQRTGKSTFARKIALLRMIILQGHKTAWGTPHKEDDPVPSVLMPFGCHPEKGKDYKKILSVWEWVQDNIDKGKHLHLTVVWDEFGGYGDGFQMTIGGDLRQSQEEAQRILGLGLRSVLREAAKHDYHPIFIAHGDQATFYPGVPGLFQTMKQSTIKVETIGKVVDDLGKMEPSGEAVITWLDNTTSHVCLPPWLSEELLVSLVPSQPQAKAA